MSQNFELFLNSSNANSTGFARLNCSAGGVSLNFIIKTPINNNTTLSAFEQVDLGDVVRRFDCSVQHPLD